MVRQQSSSLRRSANLQMLDHRDWGSSFRCKWDGFGWSMANCQCPCKLSSGYFCTIPFGLLVCDRLPFLQRGFAAAAADDEKLTVTVPVPYKTHKIEPPSQDVETSKCEKQHVAEHRVMSSALCLPFILLISGAIPNQSCKFQ
jgi:hypothetical protein